jgi:hypothetical protein
MFHSIVCMTCKSSTRHDCTTIAHLKVAILQTCYSLGSVDQQRQLRLVVSNCSRSAAREVITSHRFGLGKIPSGAEVPGTAEHLTAVRVGENFFVGGDGAAGVVGGGWWGGVNKMRITC